VSRGDQKEPKKKGKKNGGRVGGAKEKCNQDPKVRTRGGNFASPL